MVYAFRRRKYCKHSRIIITEIIRVKNNTKPKNIYEAAIAELFSYKGEMAMMNVDRLVEIIKTNTTLEVTVNEVQKGNVTLTGVSIGNGIVRPTLYTRDYEDLYDMCGYEVVAREMLNKAKEELAKINLNPVDIMSYTTWEYAKRNLKLCIAPKGTNRGVVTYSYLDLELYVRVCVKDMSNENRHASYKVQPKMLGEWNVTSEQLLQTALDCTKPTYKVQSMAEILGFSFENEVPILVVNTEDGLNGASSIYCKDILKQIADKYDKDLLIIPSSIHEIIMNPIKIPMEMSYLNGITELVKEVNMKEVSPEEVLSDHAYVFHRDTMEITW